MEETSHVKKPKPKLKTHKIAEKLIIFPLFRVFRLIFFLVEKEKLANFSECLFDLPLLKYFFELFEKLTIKVHLCTKIANKANGKISIKILSQGKRTR